MNGPLRSLPTTRRRERIGVFRVTGRSEHFVEVLRQREHLTRRAAAGNHHVVGNRRFAGKVDRDDLLRFAVLERLYDETENCLAGFYRFGAG